MWKRWHPFFGLKPVTTVVSDAVTCQLLLRMFCFVCPKLGPYKTTFWHLKHSKTIGVNTFPHPFPMFPIDPAPWIFVSTQVATSPVVEDSKHATRSAWDLTASSIQRHPAAVGNSNDSHGSGPGFTGTGVQWSKVPMSKQLGWNCGCGRREHPQRYEKKANKANLRWIRIDRNGPE